MGKDGSFLRDRVCDACMLSTRVPTVRIASTLMGVGPCQRFHRLDKAFQEGIMRKFVWQARFRVPPQILDSENNGSITIRFHNDVWIATSRPDKEFQTTSTSVGVLLPLCPTVGQATKFIPDKEVKYRPISSNSSAGRVF